MERIEVFESPGFIVTVHHPDLTDEERARRMEQLKKVTADFLRHVEEVKRNQERNNG